MDITFTGVIVEASPVRQGVSQKDGKPWAAQEYVIEEVNQRYPSRCVFQVFGQDRLQEFGIRQGENVTVHLGIDANRSKDGRWFNKLDCWKVEGRQSYPQPQPQQSVFGQGGANGGGFNQPEDANPPF